MTSPSESTVTEQAVEAAARAMWKRDYAPMGREFMDQHEPERWHRELAQRAVAAAVPVLFAALADEIKNYDDKPFASVDHVDGWQTGLADALDLVRSAAGRWGSDAK